MAITLNGSTGITTDIDGDESLTLNRDTSDGDIITLQKDNTTVGSIIAASGDIALGNGTVGVKVHSGVSSLIPYNLTAISARDNAIDIGYSTNRFKDLYLSGGVYLGGTGSANYLDDYEEGTWTPSFGSASGCFSSATSVTSYSRCNYVKIGSEVSVYGIIDLDASLTNAEGKLQIAGLPFTPAADEYATGTGQIYNSHGGADSEVVSAGVLAGGDVILYRGTVNGTTSFVNIHFAVKYKL